MSVRHSLTPAVLRGLARALDERPGDYDALLEMARDRAFVLLGEATHGTHEFYVMRAEITRRLIAEAGFDAVALEADWPDTLRLNRYVRGAGDDTLDEAFGDFDRFPTWMWRNRAMCDFVQWLREHNRRTQGDVGLYGLDLYSLYRSADAVVGYLERTAPEHAATARRLLSCLDHVRDPQDYGYEAAAGLRQSCNAAIRRLIDDLARRADSLARTDAAALDAHFEAERNAHVVLRAEAYYRAMFDDRVHTWNLRDAHMVDTALALRRHLRMRGREGRIVIWAHNSHLGDARATEMGEHGEWNIGQLLREQIGAGRTLLVGFTTYTGHVTAAREWDQPPERRWVRPARRDSYEHAFHASGLDRFFLPLSQERGRTLGGPLLERAIGVVYRPESERASHYFDARLGEQFDAVFHLDETTAVEPLDIHERWVRHETPETYPFGV